MAAAFISGGANAIVASGLLTIVDPEHFNLQHASTLLSTAALFFVVSGVISLMNFLRTKPVPDLKTVTTSVESTKVIPAQPATGTPITVVVTRKEETHTEPVVQAPTAGTTANPAPPVTPNAQPTALPTPKGP